MTAQAPSQVLPRITIHYSQEEHPHAGGFAPAGDILEATRVGDVYNASPAIPERAALDLVLRAFKDMGRICPLCDVVIQGFPLPDRLNPGCRTTIPWPADIQWINRMDLGAFVCAACHAALGPDKTREAALRT